MKRRLIAGVAALALFAAVASPASADRGSPGSTFPEAPGSHVSNGCNSIAANAGNGVANMSPTAGAIVEGLFADACLGG